MAEQKDYNYTVVFEVASEGGYVVHVPALPGLVTQGETMEEARAMAKDAIEGYLSVLKEDGEDIPVESDDTVVAKIRATAP